MFDARIRPLIDPTLNRLGMTLHQQGISANTISLAGFAVGMLSVPALAMQAYFLALVLILLNRVADGLDGAVARCSTATDIGAYLDIVLDFIFYSAVVFGFALAQPDQAVFAAFLIFSFIGSGSSFLAFAIFAQKHGFQKSDQGMKSIYYLSGLTEGFETIVFFVTICLIPDMFWALALGFGLLCWVSTLMRMLSARSLLQATGNR